LDRRLARAARTLRRNATSAERRLWEVLRRKQVGGFRFRRQVILGGFIADFACLDARLIVEVDGATHSTEEEIARDLFRTTALTAQGFVVLRVTNDDVFHNLDGVAETVAMKLAELRPRIDDARLEMFARPPTPARPRKGGGRALPLSQN
jgi:very-short-patch-repair endonuclease